MKTQKKFIILILIIMLLVSSVIVFKTVSQKVEATEISKTSNFSKKGYFEELEDSWIYFFDILNYYNLDKKQYVFDGYNMKYIYLDDYTIKYQNADTHEIIDRIVSETPILARSDTYGEEIAKINEYFNDKKFDKEITLSDLSNLNVKFISKNLLVKMFNNALNSDALLEPGKYINYSHLGKTIIDSSDNNKWELTYINDFGYIKYVNIDCILKDGGFLSDKIEVKKELDKISKEIEQKQSFENINLSGLPKAYKENINKLLETTTNKLK